MTTTTTLLELAETTRNRTLVEQENAKIRDRVRRLREQVGDGASADGGMIPPTQYGWTETPSTPGTFTHAKGPGHRIMVHASGWTHRGPDGKILKSGKDQASLTEYAKTITGDWGGSSESTEHDLHYRLAGIRRDAVKLDEAHALVRERLRRR